MRSAISTLILNVALLAAPVASHAQSSRFVVTLHGGGALPQGNLGGWWRPGYLVGGTAEYALENHLAVGIDVQVAKSDHDRSSLFGFGPVDHLTMTSVAGLVRWMPGSPKESFVPYFSAGAGSYQIDEDFTDDPSAYAPADARQNALGFRGGMGFRWRRSEYMSFEVSADYHYVATDREKTYYDQAPWMGFQVGLCFGSFGETESESDRDEFRR
jgi:outer membrane protein W